MRILLAGATGVIGRQAVPVLAAAGHQVVGLARTRPGSPTPRSWPPTPWTQPPWPRPFGPPAPR
jgi:nucleoside-diphosphate-sugar epimerase